MKLSRVEFPEISGTFCFDWNLKRFFLSKTCALYLAAMQCMIGLNEWELLPEKAIWWAKRKTLIVSDIHLGKAGHFRKHGIGVPVDANLENLARLSRLIDEKQAMNILVLGDLFHSDRNPEWEVFTEWLKTELERGPLQSMHLIKGNHDVLLPMEWKMEGLIVDTELHDSGLFFVHDPKEYPVQQGEWTVCGHIHPAVRLVGEGRQSLRLPCWWLNQKTQQLTMPAFGSFTGSFTVRPNKEDTCYVTTGSAVLEV